MRINTRLSNADGNVFDCLEIKYALLGCLAFTNRHDKLREMLLYVLLCSATLDEKLAGECSIYDIIDHMTGIIGPDYKNRKGPAATVREHGGYAPAEILSSLDKESKLVLFNYMNDSEISNLNIDLSSAKQKLEEKLNCAYGDVKNMPVFQVDEYLKLINEYLTVRLNQISVSIAKELYKGNIT